MSERLIDLLLRLAPRERLLLGLLCLLVVPLGLWLGWLAPLAETRQQALRDLGAAQALNRWVQDRAGEQALLVRDQDAGAAIGPSGLEQSLIAAHLRDHLSELSNRAEDGVELRFDAVPFEALALWLAASDPVWGYDIRALHIERGTAPGLVFADLTLVPTQ